MKFNKTTRFSFFFFGFIVYCGISCTTKTLPQNEAQQMQHELATINSLLRDAAFTQSMAKSLDSSYYAGIGQAPPEFVTQQEDTTVVIKRLKDEKIAISLAGFYALECGIGLLSAQTAKTPVELLRQITKSSIDTNTILLFNRFANATWKAGQPFRGLSRITRPNFIVASFLSPDEVKKDSVQIAKAASKLLASMDTVSKSTLPQQMLTLRRLLQDTLYAVEMAAYSNLSFAISQNQKPAPFLTPADDTATIKKSVKEIKISTNIAGFYALECGLNYLVTTRHLLPSAILKSLTNNTISKEDKMIFARFANATWKAGQPFRGLDRITRSTFTPFYFLTESDIEKDMAQIKTAAQKLLVML